MEFGKYEDMIMQGHVFDLRKDYHWHILYDLERHRITIEQLTNMAGKSNKMFTGYSDCPERRTECGSLADRVSSSCDRGSDGLSASSSVKNVIASKANTSGNYNEKCYASTSDSEEITDMMNASKIFNNYWRLEVRSNDEQDNERDMSREDIMGTKHQNKKKHSNNSSERSSIIAEIEAQARKYSEWDAKEKINWIIKITEYLSLDDDNDRQCVTIKADPEKLFKLIKGGVNIMNLLKEMSSTLEKLIDNGKREEWLKYENLTLIEKVFELQEELNQAKRSSGTPRTVSEDINDLRNISEQINKIATVCISLCDSINSLREKIDKQDRIISDLWNSTSKSNTTENIQDLSADRMNTTNDSNSTTQTTNKKDDRMEESATILCTRADNSPITDDEFRNIICNMKREIHLRDYEITSITTNWTTNKKIIFQITNDDALAKAKTLVNKIKELVSEEIKITVIYPKTAIKITGLDLITTDRSITEAIVGNKNIDKNDIKITRSLLVMDKEQYGLNARNT